MLRQLIEEAMTAIFGTSNDDYFTSASKIPYFNNVSGQGFLPKGLASVSKFTSVLGAASQGTITTNDYDSAENFGMYVVNGTSATNAVLDWGRLFVIPQTQTHCLQVKYAANARKIIIRYKYKTSSMPSPIWTEWSEVNVTAL